MKNLTLILAIFLFLGCNLKSYTNNDLIQVKEILYKDNLNNYFFQYTFPERKIINGSDVGITKYGYDSLINLDTKIVSLKKIIDYHTFKKTNGKYEDVNYYYTENEFLTVPKYTATKKNNNDMIKNKLCPK